MKINMIPTADIKPYEKNPRINAEAVPQVVKSIKEFGFQQPLVVDKNMVLIVGHTRLLAAKELGLTEVPVVIADLTDAKAKAYRLMDNRTHERSTWDDTLLIQEVMELGDFYTPEFLDFDHLDFPKEDEQPQGDPDEVPDEVPAITKPGDLYLLDPYYECSVCKKIYAYEIGKDLKECTCGVAA
jgi:site-specific DNA-methyltransferase (adenine-specific)